MFRQIIAYRWAEGVTEDDKGSFRAAFGGLVEIPELISVRFADDARHFEGNFDAVAVMDFPSSTAARRYVVDERHQAYIRDFASTMIGERVVVQHDWAIGEVAGLRHVAPPVADVQRSAEWYSAAFGFVPTGDAADVAGETALVHTDSAVRLVLRLDPARARALAGINALTLAVATVDDLDAIVSGLDGRSIAHRTRMAGDAGVHIDVVDPDGHVVRLSTFLAQ